MAERFEIALEEWLPGQDGDPSLQATTAEISIKVGSRYATEVEDRRAKTVRTSIRASAALLASWLLSNWWRLRWEPYKKLDQTESLDWELSHSLAATGGGYVWPPLTFASDGASILVKCEGQTKSDSEDLSPIRYLNSFAGVIEPGDFESAVVGFVERVLDRLNTIKVRNTLVHELWAETTSELKDPRESSQRKLEALLGLDPEENDSLVKLLMKRWQGQIGQNALEEIAAATASESVQNVLGAAQEAAQSIKVFAQVAEFHKLRASLDSEPSHHGGVPWKLGRDAAYIVRDSWGFGMGPIPTEAIADRLQIPPSELDENRPHTPFSFAVKGNNEQQLGIVLSRRHSPSRRFDVARLIGDHLVFETNDSWRPATRSFTARQKFQRAFAAEFLCPSDELARRYGARVDLDDLDDVTLAISKEYEVSEKIVLNHLANRALIPSWAAGDGQSGFMDTYRNLTTQFE